MFFNPLNISEFSDGSFDQSKKVIIKCGFNNFDDAKMMLF